MFYSLSNISWSIIPSIYNSVFFKARLSYVIVFVVCVWELILFRSTMYNECTPKIDEILKISLFRYNLQVHISIYSYTQWQICWLMGGRWTDRPLLEISALLINVIHFNNERFICIGTLLPQNINLSALE